MRQQCLHMHDLNYCFKFFKDRIKLCSMGKSTKKKDESFKTVSIIDILGHFVHFKFDL